MKPFAAFCVALLLIIPAACGHGSARQLAGIVVREYPHDPAAFTQGLVWDQGKIFESTGIKGHSSLRRVALTSGEVEQILKLDPQIFAEGITVFQNHIYQLTWTDNLIFQYDKQTFAKQNTFSWPHEGWGITHDNKNLIVSDGSASLYFLDPKTLTETRRITVHDGWYEITRLNELEYIDGLIYANVWHKCQIALIKPEDGTITAWLDLTELCQKMQKDREDVLNGIMYDTEKKKLFVTGKLWPKLFEIKVPSRSQEAF